MTLSFIYYCNIIGHDYYTNTMNLQRAVSSAVDILTTMLVSKSPLITPIINGASLTPSETVYPVFRNPIVMPEKRVIGL